MEKRQPPKKESQRPDSANFTSKTPIVGGQAAEVLEILRKNGPTVSFELTAIHAIPEAAARIHDLKAAGFNVTTVILPEYMFRGRVRRRVAKYALGSPEWFPPTADIDGAS